MQTEGEKAAGWAGSRHSNCSWLLGVNGRENEVEIGNILSIRVRGKKGEGVIFIKRANKVNNFLIIY